MTSLQTFSSHVTFNVESELPQPMGKKEFTSTTKNRIRSLNLALTRAEINDSPTTATGQQLCRRGTGKPIYFAVPMSDIMHI